MEPSTMRIEVMMSVLLENRKPNALEFPLRSHHDAQTDLATGF
jgi:hypothetical protein